MHRGDDGTKIEREIQMRARHRHRCAIEGNAEISEVIDNWQDLRTIGLVDQAHSPSSAHEAAEAVVTSFHAPTHPQSSTAKPKLRSVDKNLGRLLTPP